MCVERAAGRRSSEATYRFPSPVPAAYLTLAISAKHPTILNPYGHAKIDIGKTGIIIIFLISFALAKGCQALFGTPHHHRQDTEHTDK